MTKLLRQLSRMPLAPVIAAIFGLIAIILVAMTPLWLLERLVSAAGLPALIPAASPPLGATARALCLVMAGATTFGLLWIMLTPLQTLVRKRRPQKAKGSRIGAVVPATDPVRMKRPPIFAERELGAPFMSDEAIAGSSAPESPSAAIVPPPRLDETGVVGAPVALPTVVEAENLMAGAEPESASPAPPAPVLVSDTVSLSPNSGLADELARLESAVSRRNARGQGARPRAVATHDRTRSTLRGLA